MRAVLIPLVLLACWIPVAAAQQPHAVEAVVIEGPVYENPAVTPLEVAQSLDAVRQEIAAAKETYGEDSAQVRLLTEILHNLEGTFRQQLTDRGMIRTAGHQESADEEEHEADDEQEEGDDDDEDDGDDEAEADDEDEEHEAEEHIDQHRGQNDEAIARLAKQVRQLRDEVEELKSHARHTPGPHFAPPMPGPPTGTWQPNLVPLPAMPPQPPQAWPPARQPATPAFTQPVPAPNAYQPSEPRSPAEVPSSADIERDQRRREFFRRMLEVQQQRGGPQVDELRQARERIAQLERENAALRQQRGSAPAGPRAERVLNALRDQTMQHQAEATKRIEQSFAQMQRRLQELEQRQPMQRPREERRIEERRREDRRPRTSSAQPL